ncbi:MAG: hypothetical protein COB04_02480 [Gammaproteobacteria bacterium]|nr:MAG: hypothetical protein COB04_02480 [Gammaproteobacteria bacterium]
MPRITAVVPLFVTLSVLLNPLLCQASSTASNIERLGVSYGSSYAKQNIKTLHYSEVFYHRRLFPQPDRSPQRFNALYEFNLGALMTKAKTGYLVGVGPRFEFTAHRNISFAGAFRLVYLDEFIYRSKDKTRKRNYGGHRQFEYYAEAIYRVSRTLSLGYRWLHMSNGQQALPERFKYEHNPVVETHNIVLLIPL